MTRRTSRLPRSGSARNLYLIVDPRTESNFDTTLFGLTIETE